MSEIESSVSQVQTVDKEAIDSVSRVEQQLTLLSISLASGSRSSNDQASHSDNVMCDDRVSDDESHIMVVGGLPRHKIQNKCKS